ncbi:carboxypeptidase-like regulatory domain-containing protein [Nocardioides sp. SYSU D00038]|uniref:carboxypeptidase-like regulatory domain-containing protein n=1 Tax=Nocardioides sp. SYSU D00038 TaxID=2812554 RepID=UPI0019683BBB|nr:carboxypeptidase-like regulatory domain-containing protein [Nocardioides sp. SYSU D00038]
MHPTQGRRPVLLLLATALVAVLGAGLLAPPTAQAAVGRVRGTVTGGGDDSPPASVAWFRLDWTYLGKRRVTGGGYSLALPPGTYRLQFTDRRPAYDVRKLAPRDVTVTVTAGATTIRNVRMPRGAAIGGTVRAGGKVAPGARVVAANADRRSFETTADRSGSYALAGLPAGTYSVFTYDRKRTWVGRSTFLRRLKPGRYKRVDVRLGIKAGRLVLDLYAGSTPYPGTTWVTLVSRRSGQFWTQRMVGGTTTVRGLHPGGYDVVADGVGSYLGGTLPVTGRVRKGRVAFGTARLTRLGATVTGTVVDANRPGTGLAGAQVRLRDASGATLQTATTRSDGGFTLGGQLTTRSDLSVVVGPGPYSPYLGQGVSYCKYGSATRSGVAVVTGRATALGTVALPHLPDAQQDGAQCHTPPPAQP